MFKFNINDSRAITLFCLDVDRVILHWFQAKIYLFKVNNIDTRIICGKCSKLTMKTTDRCQ